MKIIGLTGPTGAGKGELCTCLGKAGIPSINTDRVYHQLLTPPSPCLDALVAHFGSDILKEDGTLDRRKLASIVFAPDAEAEHEALNRITHAFVRERVLELINDYTSSSCIAVCLDVPLLFESGFDEMCDLTVAVLANRVIRTDRIMTRDGLDHAAAMSRISAQPSDEFYTERADIVIHNNLDLDALSQGCRAILDALEKKDES